MSRASRVSYPKETVRMHAPRIQCGRAAGHRTVEPEEALLAGTRPDEGRPAGLLRRGRAVPPPGRAEPAPHGDPISRRHRGDALLPEGHPEVRAVVGPGRDHPRRFGEAGRALSAVQLEAHAAVAGEPGRHRAPSVALPGRPPRAPGFPRL